jgi:hypothetical protein
MGVTNEAQVVRFIVIYNDAMPNEETDHHCSGARFELACSQSTRNLSDIHEMVLPDLIVIWAQFYLIRDLKLVDIGHFRNHEPKLVPGMTIRTGDVRE